MVLRVREEASQYLELHLVDLAKSMQASVGFSAVQQGEARWVYSIPTSYSEFAVFQGKNK